MILRPAVRGPRDRHNALSGRPACAGHSETRLASIPWRDQQAGGVFPPDRGVAQSQARLH